MIAIVTYETAFKKATGKKTISNGFAGVSFLNHKLVSRWPNGMNKHDELSQKFRTCVSGQDGHFDRMKRSKSLPPDTFGAQKLSKLLCGRASSRTPQGSWIQRVLHGVMGKREEKGRKEKGGRSDP